jgi:hypothetical protein
MGGNSIDQYIFFHVMVQNGINDKREGGGTYFTRKNENRLQKTWGQFLDG